MIKKLLSSTKIVFVTVSLLLLLMGCQPTVNQGIEATLTTETIFSKQETAVTIVPTHSISQIVTSISMPIPTATSSPTVPPTQTPLPTATVTPISWPTLPPDEVADKVLALLADNQNPDCLLPCWWGATPGQTHWLDIEPFLSHLAKEIHYSSLGLSFGSEVVLPLPETVVTNNFSGYHIFYGWGKSGVIHGIFTSSVNIAGYDPQTMMTLHGVPDEVWLKTLDAPREGILPFQLIIVYQQKGISFRYYVNATSTYETVTACFEPGVVELERPDLFPAGPRIYLWEPGIHKTIDEIANIPGETYYLLEEKTDLTTQTLYDQFTNPNEKSCIDTPADFWRE